MSEDAAQTVYHATCALELATDILVDLYTFFSPPAPNSPFFVLRTPDAAAPQQTAGESVRIEGVGVALLQEGIRSHLPSRAGLFLKWDRRRHLFQQLQDLLRGMGQTQLLTEKNGTIKTGLRIEGVLTLIPGHLLW